MAKFNQENLSYRFLTSFLFIPFFLVIFNYGSYPYLFLMLGIIAIMAYEFFYLLREKGLNPYLRTGIFASVLLGFIMNYSSALFTYFLITLLLMFISIFELKRNDPAKSIVYMSVTTFGVLYTGWLGGHMILLGSESYNILNSPKLIYLSFLMIWMADTGAFFVGSKFGKHKIIPKISPSKSYEGLLGGFIFSLISGFIFSLIFFKELNMVDVIVFSLISSLGGLAGDLVESAMKRDAKLKDVSSFLPGHGGVLDRFDSILFALPLFYYYFIFVIKSRLL
ncbi:MAG: phosphatidate cytidylyltransferase [candidate division WOR-3 bacterium]